MVVVGEGNLLVGSHRPQLDFTPGVGQKVGVDRRCDLTVDWEQEQ
jgi:hypothetical protein